MSFISLTEAITELAFARRENSVDLITGNVADLEIWSERFRALSKAAHAAAAAVGRDLDFYRYSDPSLDIEHPTAVLVLFAACANREQRRADFDKAFSSSAIRIIDAAALGVVDLFGRFGGQGELKAIPPYEMYQLALIPEFGFDVLTVRATWEQWSHVIVGEPKFGKWLEGECCRTTTRDQAGQSIAALRVHLQAEPKLTAKAAEAFLRERHGIEPGAEAIKRDLLPEARRLSGLEPRGPGRPRKSGLENREKK